MTAPSAFLGTWLCSLTQSDPECDPHSARRVQEAGLCEQQRAFEFFDRDRDARVTVDDFTWAVDQLGLTGEGTVGLTKARPITCHTAGTFWQGLGLGLGLGP